MAWNGQIRVVPADLEASAPGFAGASDEVASIVGSVKAQSANAVIGDPTANAAWGLLLNVWSKTLQELGSRLSDISTKLASGAIAYRWTDDNAVPSLPSPSPPTGVPPTTLPPSDYAPRHPTPSPQPGPAPSPPTGTTTTTTTTVPPG